jgi:hypothetical protein
MCTHFDLADTAYVILQSELEDLSFAVLDPEKFEHLHTHLSATWGSHKPRATPRKAAPSTATLPARPSQEPSFARYPETSAQGPQPIVVEPRRPQSSPRPAYAELSYGETGHPGGSHANTILPLTMRHSLGRTSLSLPSKGHAPLGEGGRSCTALTEPLSERRTAILSVPQGSRSASTAHPMLSVSSILDGDTPRLSASTPHPMLSGPIPMEGEVAGYWHLEGNCGASGVQLDSPPFSRGREPPREFWNPSSVPRPLAGSHAPHGRQGLHVKQLGFAMVDAVDPAPSPERPGKLQEVVLSARNWLESVGALPTEQQAHAAEPVARQNPSLFRGRFLSDGDHKVQLEAKGEKRKDGCVVWKFPHPEPPVLVPDQEQQPVSRACFFLQTSETFTMLFFGFYKSVLQEVLDQGS